MLVERWLGCKVVHMVDFQHRAFDFIFALDCCHCTTLSNNTDKSLSLLGDTRASNLLCKFEPLSLHFFAICLEEAV